MPPTPVTATHLVVCNYSVDGLDHKLQMYANAIPSADPSGFDLVGRVGIGNPGFSTIVDPMFTTIHLWYEATKTTFVGFDLFEKIGDHYVPVASKATTVAAAGTDAYNPAQVTDFVGKSPATRNMHTYLAEGAWGVASKITSPVGQPASYVSIIDYFWAVTRAAIITDAANWRLSRGAVNTVRWLSAVNDTNEKLRRLRGLK